MRAVTAVSAYEDKNASTLMWMNAYTTRFFQPSEVKAPTCPDCYRPMHQCPRELSWWCLCGGYLPDNCLYPLGLVGVKV